MKKTLVFTLFAIYYLLFTSFYTYAVSTPTDTQKSQVNKQVTESSDVINELKERIASRVAELKLVERRGIIGITTDISSTQITISDPNNKTRFIDVDELTKFSSSSQKESFGISDITKGDKISALGLYNKQSQRILARFVNVVALPKVVNGAVLSVDKESFSIKVITTTGEINTVDIEKVTKTLAYTKSVGLTRSGFSKIKEGQHIITIGFPDINEKKRIVASRFLIFPDIPMNPRINIPQEALNPQEDTTPSTGSGKKLTPITR